MFCKIKSFTIRDDFWTRRQLALGSDYARVKGEVTQAAKEWEKAAGADFAFIAMRSGNIPGGASVDISIDMPDRDVHVNFNIIDNDSKASVTASYNTITLENLIKATRQYQQGHAEEINRDMADTIIDEARSHNRTIKAPWSALLRTLAPALKIPQQG